MPRALTITAVGAPLTRPPVRPLGPAPGLTSPLDRGLSSGADWRPAEVAPRHAVSGFNPLFIGPCRRTRDGGRPREPEVLRVSNCRPTPLPPLSPRGMMTR